MLPGHPQTVCHEEAVGCVLVGGERKDAPFVALDGYVRRHGENNAAAAGVVIGQGCEFGLDVASDIVTQRLQDRRRGIVRHSNALCAKQTGHDARQGRSRAQLHGAQASRIKAQSLAQSKPRVFFAFVSLQGIPLDKLRQQQRRVPQVVAEQAAVRLALGLGELNQQRLGQFWRGVDEGVLCVAVLVGDVVGEDDAERRGEVIFWAGGLVALEGDAGCEGGHFYVVVIFGGLEVFPDHPLFVFFSPGAFRYSPLF